MGIIARRVTIDDVAAQAGVSIATVSRVLNGSAPVAASTHLRIKKSIERLGYVPNDAAKRLAQGRVRTLGFAIPQMSGDFFPALLAGIERGAHEAGYSLLIHTTPHASASALPRFNPLNEHTTAGVIVYPDSLPQRDLERLNDHGFPLVGLYHALSPFREASTVTFENRLAARELVQHLIRVHGRAQIAYLRGPPEHLDSFERERGYRDALEQSGLEPLVGQGDYHQTVAYQQVQRWLAAGVRFDALFAGSDEAAVGSLAALRDAGREVPDDVAVVGFDDLRFAQHLTPALTTVFVDVERAGFLAAQQLAHLVEGGEKRYVTLPTQPVYRTSCGCPRQTFSPSC